MYSIPGAYGRRPFRSLSAIRGYSGGKQPIIEGILVHGGAG